MNAVEQTIHWLQSLPTDEKNRLTAQVLDTQERVKFIPNPGPQTLAFLSPADIMLYGGAAGGGKSTLLAGLALTSHQRSLIMRRNYSDLDAIAEETIKLNKTRNGFVGGTRKKLRTEDGRIIEFGACQHAGDEESWQGHAHDLKCVGKGTPVLMANGTYKAIEDMSVGDMVQTLEGEKRVTKIWPRRRDHSVVMKAMDNCGNTIESQVQSVTHSVLTSDGWVSYDTFGESPHFWTSLPKLFLSVRKFSQPFLSIFSSFLRHLSGNSLGLAQKKGRFQLFLGHQCLPGLSASCALSGAEICFVSSYDGTPDALPPPLSSLFLEPRLTRSRQSWFSFSLPGSSHDASCVLWLSSLANYLSSCLSGIRLCGERILQFYGLRSGSASSQLYLHQSSDVAQPTPKSSVGDGLGNTPLYNLVDLRSYPHPYRKDIRSISASVRASAFSFSYNGIVDLYDIEVEDSNHYITSGGFVNKNCFDEVTHFLESQVRYIIAWNRLGPGVEYGQRCRVVLASNPPTGSGGDWIIPFFGPWLDPNHHNPAKPGELRFFVTDPDGKDMEVPDSSPVEFSGRKEPIIPKTRTFIPAKLSDNPYLIKDNNYIATLDALPEPLRSAMRDGNFMLSRSDSQDQVIPSAWIRAAQARWSQRPPKETPMSAMGVDVAQGGADSTTLSRRHDWWFDRLIEVPRKQTPEGSDVAALVVKYRRDNCDVIIDMGGGYGGAPKVHLEDSNIKVIPFKGALGSTARDRGGNLGFVNRRSEIWWKFREALDPDQPGGSPIALPDDQRLVSDLTAPTYQTVRHKGRLCVKVEPKEDVKDRLGRSTDRGDAVVMSWASGTKGIAKNIEGYSMDEHGELPEHTRKSAPKVNVGHENKRRNR